MLLFRGRWIHNNLSFGCPFLPFRLIGCPPPLGQKPLFLPFSSLFNIVSIVSDGHWRFSTFDHHTRSSSRAENLDSKQPTPEPPTLSPSLAFSMSQAISFRRKDNLNSSTNGPVNGSFKHMDQLGVSPKWRASPMSFKMGSLVGSLGARYGAPGCSPTPGLE